MIEEQKECRVCGGHYPTSRSERIKRIKQIEVELMDVIHDHDNHDVYIGEQFEALAGALLAVAGHFQYQDAEPGVDLRVLERLSDMIRLREKLNA